VTWTKLSDDFSDHPKVAQLSNEAYRLHVDALVYCGRFQTDGIVEAAVVARLAAGKLRRPNQAADELVRVGLWHQHEGVYSIHNYGRYQPSKEEVAKRAHDKARAGRMGAQARWRKADAMAPAMARD
jgi:hypothetical protein